MIQTSLFECAETSAARAIINARVEIAAQEAIDEIKAMADSARKAINYSVGQQARRMRERLDHDRFMECVRRSGGSV